MQVRELLTQVMIKYRSRSYSINVIGLSHINPLFSLLRRSYSKFASLSVLLCFIVIIPLAITKSAQGQESGKVMALLGIKFQNDHMSQEPTTDAELRRLEALKEGFENQINASGKYKVIHVPETIKAKIDSGQFMGECGGCEISYGKAIGSDIGAWIVVQKVSNLILNINLYMVDINSQKPLLVQSVDIRGNTDESWKRGLNYLLSHHVLNH
jgi:hypothetical protein